MYMINIMCLPYTSYNVKMPYIIQLFIRKIEKSVAGGKFTSIGSECWFHEKITAEQAARLVSSGPNGRKDGLFLVRESYEQSGSFVLTLWALNQVRHFQIVGRGEKCFSIDNGLLLRGINHLMDHYKGLADCGMFSKLTAFVIGAPPPPWAVVKRVDTEYHKAVRNGDVGLLKRLLSQQFSTAYLNSYNPVGLLLCI